MAEQKKKMNVMQLTFIVMVNMMGSGIIMLPSNMAKVGAISLLSWIVTALGSLSLAAGRHLRTGGPAALKMPRRDGYFQVFFPDFLSWRSPT
jgi:putrescine:ornithine antiporter